MELVGSAINAALVILIGALLSWQMNGRFRALEGRMDRIEGRMDRIEARMDRLEGQVHASIEALRSDITQIALAVGAKPRSGP